MSARSDWADVARLNPGQSATHTLQIDQAMVDRMAQLTGDDNPIHVDPAAAHRFGQSRPTAHGMILMGLLSRIIGTELPGPGSIWYQNDIEFVAPVFAGDTVTLTVTVRHVSLVTRVVVLDVHAIKAGDTVVAKGQARVRVPAPITRQETHMPEQSQVALVTGASGGIGGAIARVLAASGMSVIVGYHGGEAAAAECVKEIRDAGGTVIPARADLLDRNGPQAMVTAGLDAFGRIDAVVHAATPKIVAAPFMDTPVQTFRDYHEAYVCVLAELVRLTAPGMKERRHGRVITLLSSAIAENPPKMAAYVTAKSAALGLCRALAAELGPWNITVNAISPSMVVGQHTDDIGAAAREIMMRKTPLRRLAEADDVARAVRFLIGADASFVSGAHLPVTGGILL